MSFWFSRKRPPVARIEPIRADERRDPPQPSDTRRAAKIVPMAPQEFMAKSAELREDFARHGDPLARMRYVGRF